MTTWITGPAHGNHVPVVVVGGGQAGLSVSYYLQRVGLEHVVLERQYAMHAWEDQRWDNFCLVTPNWQCQLPGYAYSKEFGGREPEGFMTKAQLRAYLAGFRQAVNAPLSEGVEVQRIRRSVLGGFDVITSAGDYHCDAVVVATSAYHAPNIPVAARHLPPHIVQLDPLRYRSPAALPPGGVMVVGSGQSGCQIAEDLHLAGRSVHLCTGRAPRVNRRYRGQDVVKWLDEMGHYAMTVAQHPLKEGVRRKANHYVTGRDGGRDIDLRVLAQQGMQLYGRLLQVDGLTWHFADDLAANLDAADATCERIRRSIDDFIAKTGRQAPQEPPYVPCWRPSASACSLDLARAGIGSVIWATGYSPRFSAFVAEDVFDERGMPVHERGVTAVAGLYFVGLPWLHTWGSGRFSAIAADAAHLVEHLRQTLRTLSYPSPALAAWGAAV